MDIINWSHICSHSPHKQLMYTVNVGTPDPRFVNMLLNQFKGER